MGTRALGRRRVGTSLCYSGHRRMDVTGTGTCAGQWREADTSQYCSGRRPTAASLTWTRAGRRRNRHLTVLMWAWPNGCDWEPRRLLQYPFRRSVEGGACVAATPAGSAAKFSKHYDTLINMNVRDIRDPGAPAHSGLHPCLQLRVVPHLGLYPIITLQYSSTTLCQVSYHSYSVAVFHK
jgi:hypothetical protein